MQMLKLFPTPLGITTITEDISVLENKIGDLQYEKIGDGTSQISLRLDILKDFPEIEQILLKKFIEYMGDISPNLSNFQITTSWVTRCLARSGNSSSVHTHKNSMYSGVLYLSDCKSSGYFKMQDPLEDIKVFYTGINRSPTEFSASTFMMKPEKYDLIFFPSYIRHSITEYNEKNIRYSLAFNIVPVGQFGNADSTLTIEKIS